MQHDLSLIILHIISYCLKWLYVCYDDSLQYYDDSL